MRLHIENLGRIQEAKLAIKPLTIFIGPNETQKTWAAYGLYALAQGISGKFRHFSTRIEGPDLPELRDRFRGMLSPAIEALKGAEPSSTWQTNLSLEPYRSYLARGVMFTMDGDAFATQMATSRKAFAKTRLRLHLDPDDLISSPGELEIQVKGEESFIGGERFRAGSFSSAQMSVGFLFLLQDLDGMLSLLEAFCLTSMLRAFRGVIALPAERKALVILHKILSARGFESLLPSEPGEGSPQKGKTGMIRTALKEMTLSLPAPVRDFTNLMVSMDMSSPEDREPGPLANIIDLLDHKILSGSIEFTKQETLGTRLSYIMEQGGALDLHVSSSLVRALAGLDLYLKFLAQPGDLLIIDEPEMNAHPEVQLKITELLAMMVNRGIRVLVTTHSPYIVDHVTNLVEASQVPEAKREDLASHFKLGSQEAFLSPDKVGAYFFTESGKVEDIFDPNERTIDWSTFSRASDYVANLYTRILSDQD